MPKVKFLKDLCSGRAGSVQDLQDYEANVLIQLGAAEIFDEKAVFGFLVFGFRFMECDSPAVISDNQFTPHDHLPGRVYCLSFPFSLGFFVPFQQKAS